MRQRNCAESAKIKPFQRSIGWHLICPGITRTTLAMNAFAGNDRER
jgi:hypothetical protein